MPTKADDQDLSYLLETVFDLPPNSILHQALHHVGITSIREIMSMEYETIKSLHYPDYETPNYMGELQPEKLYPVPLQIYSLLIRFQGYVAYCKEQYNPIDVNNVTYIDPDDFASYPSSSHFIYFIRNLPTKAATKVTPQPISLPILPTESFPKNQDYSMGRESADATEAPNVEKDSSSSIGQKLNKLVGSDTSEYIQVEKSYNKNKQSISLADCSKSLLLQPYMFQDFIEASILDSTFIDPEHPRIVLPPDPQQVFIMGSDPTFSFLNFGPMKPDPAPNIFWHIPHPIWGVTE